jgi:transposase-like protein
MGRPPCGPEDYSRWRERVDRQRASGLSVDQYCENEGITRSSFYRWIRRLNEGGVPERSPSADHRSPPESEPSEPMFVPVSVKAAPVEIELPNGAVVRLSTGICEALLMEVIRAVGALRPPMENESC